MATDCPLGVGVFVVVVVVVVVVVCVCWHRCVFLHRCVCSCVRCGGRWVVPKYMKCLG